MTTPNAGLLGQEPAQRPLLAIVLVMFGMLLFVTTDGAAKYLTASMAPQQIIWVRYAVISMLLLRNPTV